MFRTLQVALVVAAIMGLVAAPTLIVMLALLGSGASSGMIIGLGFLAMMATAIGVASRPSQSWLKARLNRVLARG